jgi:hypothetical protein
MPQVVFSPKICLRGLTGQVTDHTVIRCREGKRTKVTIFNESIMLLAEREEVLE